MVFTVACFEGVPKIVRADRGTENINVERLQVAFRSGHEDSMSQKAFLYGKSVRNQVTISLVGFGYSHVRVCGMKRPHTRHFPVKPDWCNAASLLS